MHVCVTAGFNYECQALVGIRLVCMKEERVNSEESNLGFTGLVHRVNKYSPPCDLDVAQIRRQGS